MGGGGFSREVRSERQEAAIPDPSGAAHITWRKELLQRPRRRNELPVWDGASVSAAWRRECNKEPRDASPSPPIFGG